MPADARNRELGAIHKRAAQLGMDTHDKHPESEYRSMLWTLARARSAKDLDHAGRRRVLDHLGALLVARGIKHRPANYGRKPVVTAERQPLLDKIEALLADAKRPWRYVGSMAKRMYRIDRLEWASPEQLRGLVAALEKDARRRAARAATA